jgi:hypothetical protein
MMVLLQNATAAASCDSSAGECWGLDQRMQSCVELLVAVFDPTA